MQIEMGKKYKTRRGYVVRIIHIDNTPAYNHPVVGFVVCSGVVYQWTKTGRRYNDNELSDLDLVEVNEWEDFKIDDPVLVRNSVDEPWKRRYFAGVGDAGKPYAFRDGSTSWSTDSDPYPWVHCIRRP